MKTRRTYFLSKPVPSETVSTKFHNARLLLSHFGLIKPGSQKLKLLDETDQRVIRSLRELDRVFSREAIKIGVVYVKEGQESQNDILANETCSQSYADFMAGLGWTIDLATHEGFLGGLDKTSFTAGRTAPYYANALIEVIYHELTRMPSNPNDPQKITRKRHIGNDSVNIIWCEHKKDYRVETITTQFNDALIIIYPIEFDLFRIQISQKDKIPPFGPLQDGMVVPKRLLPLLVRLTAINANRAARSIVEGYKRPLTARLNLIKEVASRYELNTSFDEFYGRLFVSGSSDVQASSASAGSSTPTAATPTTTLTATTTASETSGEKVMIGRKNSGQSMTAPPLHASNSAPVISSPVSAVVAASSTPTSSPQVFVRSQAGHFGSNSGGLAIGRGRVGKK
eukprot:TRINITY_DN12256_c0_g1_i1.p1 TRINITY_DN12256_c0_g1~~TRINITY_DN12256_c0_g1_i1.p1  ORF type:complete len:398 (-),score=83.51 TRINITY_DN12256_c0_g1_i1:97-1290(-)